jgi:hypothetical protein
MATSKESYRRMQDAHAASTAPVSIRQWVEIGQAKDITDALQTIANWSAARESFADNPKPIRIEFEAEGYLVEVLFTPILEGTRT